MAALADHLWDKTAATLPTDVRNKNMSDETGAKDDETSYSSGATFGGGMSYGTSQMSGAISAGQASFAAQPTHTTPSAPDGNPIKDITTESFLNDVIEASKSGPVIVDFWAPWCGPCKQLGPIIEKAVTEAKGSVTLAKMDIEKYPDIAGQMGIQSIPAVVAFVNGRPADAFMGAKPESEVKAFVDKLAAANPTPEMENIEAIMSQAADMTAHSDHAGAAELFAQVLHKEPGNLDALAGLGHCYIALEQLDTAEQLLEPIPQEHREKPPIAALIKSIGHAKAAAELGDFAELAAAVEAEPQNHQARFDYALALNGAGKREEAAEQLIEIVRKDRKWNDDGARVQLVEFFEAWGNADPATLAGRRALSSILFA